MSALPKQELSHNERVVAETYAVDENNEQVTVLGTYGQDPDSRQPIPFRSWVIVAVCSLAVMQGIVGAIAAGSNQFAIVGALGNPELRPWLVQGAAIPGIVTGPIVGIASDIYGRRWIVLFLWVLQLISSIMGATAKSTQVVMGAQLLSGFANGVSGLMFSIVSEVVPTYWRTNFQTWLIVISAITSVIPLMGIGQAVIVNSTDGWRWQYYILIIFNVVVTLGFFFFYKPPARTPEGQKPFLEQLKGQDWIGYLLLCAGLVPFVLGFTYAGTGKAWADPRTYATIVVGGVFLIICLLWEWKGTSHGFLDHRLFRNGPNFIICLFLLAVEGALFYLMNNIYTEQVAVLWNDGTIKTSARYLPYFLVTVVTGPLMAWYVTKRGDLKWPLVFGFVLFLACQIGFGLSNGNKDIALAFNFVAGAGFTAPLVLLMTMSQLSAPPLFIGIASSLAITCRTLGGIIALAISTAIYGSKTNTQQPAAIAEAAIAMGVAPQHIPDVIGAYLSHNFPALAQIPGVTGPVIGAIVGASNKVLIAGFRLVWLAFVPAGALSVLGALCLRNPKDRLTFVIDAPLSEQDIKKTIIRDDTSVEKAESA